MEFPNRKLPRLNGYDYANEGYYFITICTHNRQPFPTLSSIVGLYKSGVSKIIQQINPDIKIWQSSFHDHIIRNEGEYNQIWQYIDTNTLNWEEDCFYETNAATKTGQASGGAGHTKPQSG